MLQTHNAIISNQTITATRETHTQQLTAIAQQTTRYACNRVRAQHHATRRDARATVANVCMMRDACNVWACACTLRLSARQCKGAGNHTECIGNARIGQPIRHRLHAHTDTRNASARLHLRHNRARTRAAHDAREHPRPQATRP